MNTLPLVSCCNNCAHCSEIHTTSPSNNICGGIVCDLNELPIADMYSHRCNEFALIEQDSFLEEQWDELEDVAFDDLGDGKLVTAENWWLFPARTERDDIWAYFNALHTKGVAYLLYGEESQFVLDINKVDVGMHRNDIKRATNLSISALPTFTGSLYDRVSDRVGHEIFVLFEGDVVCDVQKDIKNTYDSKRADENLDEILDNYAHAL